MTHDDAHSEIETVFDRMVRRHPAWGGRYPAAGPDHTEPDLGRCTLVALSPDTLPPDLGRFGITLEGRPGEGTFLILADGFRSLGLRIRLWGHANCLVALGEFTLLHGQVSLEGRDQSFVYAGSHHNFLLNVFMRGRAGALFVGRGGSANQVEMLVEGPGVCLSIGDDAMLSNGIHLTTSDSHGIIPVEGDGGALNPPASIRVGAHVWIGAYVTVLKGRSIGRGAIVGGRAVVARDVPACTLATGVPAEIKQVGVTWTREAQPTPAQANGIRARIKAEEGPWA